MVMEVVYEDMGDENIQCMNHPQKNSTAVGICAFCLQEKLSKLVSSTFSVAIFPSTSSSPSPSFRSDFNDSATVSGGGAALKAQHIASSSANSQTRANDCSSNDYYNRKTKLPFILTCKKKKKKDTMGSSDSSSVVFKRSKYTTTQRRRGMYFLDQDCSAPHRKGFWSFLYLSKHSTTKKNDNKDSNFAPNTPNTVCNSVGPSSINRREDFVVVEENGSPEIERKVSRSRSVGCGSRSLSGDFFERISTGFGDCTLRRVESQREGKAKVQSVNGQDCIKERVICGGIFSGFMISSSSTSSSYRDNEKAISTVHSSLSNVSHGRNKIWEWVLASPMRALGKPSNGKRDSNLNKNGNTPNLAAIPSLLAVSS